MSDLALYEFNTELAEIYEDQAEIIERFDPNDPKARVLRQVAEDIREGTEARSSEWVPLPKLEERTGWSLPTLRRRARSLEKKGLARKNPAGQWEIKRDAARQIPTKDERPDLEGMELDEMARVLGRET